MHCRGRRDRSRAGRGDRHHRRSPTWAPSPRSSTRAPSRSSPTSTRFTGNVTAEIDRALLSSRTRAIIVTHLFGNPADLAGIRAARRAGRHPGHRGLRAGLPGRHHGRPRRHGRRLSAASACSRASTSRCGEGGFVVTADPALARSDDPVRQQGLAATASRTPTTASLALNYRLTELQGAVALGPARQARPTASHRRREMAQRCWTRRSPTLDGVSCRRCAARAEPRLLALRRARRPRGRARRAGAVWPPRCDRWASRRRRATSQKPAFRCEVFADQKTFGDSRLAVHPGPARGASTTQPSGSPARSTFLDSVLVLPFNERYTAEHAEFVADGLPHRGRDGPGRVCAHDRDQRTSTGRVGLIGTGGIGQAHAQAAAGLGRRAWWRSPIWTPIGRRTSAPSTVSEVFDVAALADPDRLDLVVVASPPSTHPATRRAAAARRGSGAVREADRHVDLATARALAALAAETGTPLTMATKFRFVDDVQQTKALDRGRRCSARSSRSRSPSPAGRHVRPVELRPDDRRRRGADRQRHARRRPGPLPCRRHRRGARPPAGRGQPLVVEDSATLLGSHGRRRARPGRRDLVVPQAVAGLLRGVRHQGSVEIGWHGARGP